MPEYTYADVIIDPADPRVEIGADYYFSDYPFVVLARAQRGEKTKKLIHVNNQECYPSFSMENSAGTWGCLIRKKEPEKKYVPFDLSKEEDRARLRGAWVRNKESERELAVTGIFLDERPPFVELNDNGFTAEEFFEGFEFLDGTPCGKLVTEEE